MELVHSVFHLMNDLCLSHMGVRALLNDLEVILGSKDNGFVHSLERFLGRG
jgi:hypothetical protein